MMKKIHLRQDYGGQVLWIALLLMGMGGVGMGHDSKSVIIPGDVYTAYDIPQGGADLGLDINRGNNTNIVIDNSEILLQDESDGDVQWRLKSQSEASRVYEIETVLSSREYVHVFGYCHYLGGTGGGGGGTPPTFNAKVAAPDVDIESLTEEQEESVGAWVGKGGARKTVTVRPVQCRSPSSQQTLTWSSGKVSLWTAASGGSILPGGSKSLAADQSATYYAQGDNASGSIRDSEIATAYTVSGQTARDKVKLTVVGATISPFSTILVNATNDVSVTLSPNPPGITNTLQISCLSGSGSAVFMPSGGTTLNIGQSGTVKIKGVTASSTASNMILRAMFGSDVLASNVFTVVGTEIIEVGFTGDHMVKRWAGQSDIDNPDGTVPVWRKTNNPDDPVCYTKDGSPAMFALFNNSPAITEPLTGVKVRARIGTNVIGSAAGVTFSGSATAVYGIGGGSPIPGSDGVKTMTPTFTWELSLDNGASWCSAGNSGSHTMHFSMGAPNETPLYDRALDKACGYAGGANQPASVAAEIRSDIYGEIGSRYSGTGEWYSGSGVLQLYDTSDDLICGTYANLTANLCRSVGMSASTVWVWSGTSEVGYEWYYTTAGYMECTILVDPGSNAWWWHAVASTPEGYSDAALGVQGVNIVHRHPEATDQYEDAGNSMSSGPSIVLDAPYYHEWP